MEILDHNLILFFFACSFQRLIFPYNTQFHDLIKVMMNERSNWVRFIYFFINRILSIFN